MAILKMEHIHLVAMKCDRKRILELLQRRGTVEINDVAKSDDVFTKMDTGPTRALLDKNAETAAEAVRLLDSYVPPKGTGLAFLKGRQAVDVAVSDAFYAQMDSVLRLAQTIVQKDREVAEAKAEALRLAAQQEALKPWLSLPVAQTFRGTKQTAVFIGSINGEHELDSLYAKLAAAAPQLETLHVEIVSKSKNLTAFYVMVPRADADKAESALRTIDFVRPASPTHRLPKAKMEQLDGRIAAAKQRAEDAAEEIRGYAGRRDDIVFLEDHMLMRGEKYAAIERLAQTRHVFVLDGWVPAEKAPALERELENAPFECAVQFSPATEAEEAPVLLKNNWFSEPTESIVESFSIPGKGDVDPTAVMSIFYYVMFGLMFSDAGYGLIMAGVCGFCLLKFRNMEPNWSKNVRMFFWCGVSTMVWGIVFSSYFGDVVDSVAMTFFGREAGIPPLWFAPLDDPLKMLLFCLAIGVVHLTVGYAMKGYACIKNKDYIGVLYDAVFPGFVIYPLIVLLMGSEVFLSIGGFMLDLPPIVNTICLALAAVCAVGVILTGGRESKNWGKRIAKGIYALYSVGSGWLSDILSYSRLLALGLATGVIGSVMNQLAGLPASVPVLGVLLYIVIFLIGHGMNFGINVLGAYVHSNRLEYVEFFGKFYEGGGHKFSPLAVNTKKYKIVEEEPQNV